MHPLLDVAGNGCSTTSRRTVYILRAPSSALGHAIEHGLAFEAGNGSARRSCIPARIRQSLRGSLDCRNRLWRDRAAGRGGLASVLSRLGRHRGRCGPRRSETRPCGRSPRGPRSRVAVWERAECNRPSRRLDVFERKKPRSATTSIASTSRISRAGSAVCVSRPMSTTWLVTACSDDQLVFRADSDLNVIADGDRGEARPWRGCRDRSARSGPRRFARSFEPASRHNALRFSPSAAP